MTTADDLQAQLDAIANGVYLVLMAVLGFGVAYATLPAGLRAYWPLFGIVAAYIGMWMVLFLRGVNP